MKEIGCIFCRLSNPDNVAGLDVNTRKLVEKTISVLGNEQTRKRIKE